MVDYLAMAKNSIKETNGTHPVEVMQAWALITIAYALISIAESMRGGSGL